jgi:predicted DCC family thiol-disulfide oxidoreductase YuxK
MENFDDLGTRLLVVFDGRCGFCNRSVRWLLRRDRNDRMRFVAFESQRITDLLARHDRADQSTLPNPDTLLVVAHAGTPSERVLVRSAALLELLRALPAPWPGLAAILRLIPSLLRDLGYRLVARARFFIAGRLASCPIPTTAERSRFL